MRKLSQFLQYHNAVPIVLGILFLGAGATFAAANPDAIYSATQQVLSIDNSYIVNKDLSTWSPQIRISAVTEDSDNYYVDYALTTIDLDGYAWKDLTKSERMVVSKVDLGLYRDLGVYVTQQLKQIVERERGRLAETQDIEKKNLTAAVVATSYGGLIGQFINASTDTLPGYTPVVTGSPIAAIPGTFSGPGDAVGSSDSGSSTQSPGAQIGLQVLGNNPARLPLKATYNDLGVVLIDPLQINVGVHTFLDGVETLYPVLDTSTSTSYVIEYRATDRNGVTVLVRRIVLVGDAPDPGGEISEAGNVAPVVAPVPNPALAAPVESTDQNVSASSTPPESDSDAVSTTTPQGTDDTATSTNP